MPEEQCEVAPLIPLPTSLQHRYDELQAPQCTNLTYINTFLNKMLLFINDNETRNILCHLNEAARQLDHIHVSKTQLIYIIILVAITMINYCIIRVSTV